MSPEVELERRVEEANGFEERVADVLQQRHRWRWRMLTAWIIVFSLTVILMYSQSRHLASENRSRISDIQESRIASCKDNYEGIRKVFAPLAIPKAARTIRQAEQIAKFNESINKLKLTCGEQTKLK
jgi:hypothetical protein